MNYSLIKHKKVKPGFHLIIVQDLYTTRHLNLEDVLIYYASLWDDSDQENYDEDSPDIISLAIDNSLHDGNQPRYYINVHHAGSLILTFLNTPILILVFKHPMELGIF